MPPEEATRPDETSQGAVEIRQDAAITIQEALLIAFEQSFPIGKSTLQRWAKVWADRGVGSVVKSVLVTSRAGSIYRLDRDDFKAWLFDQKQNMRPGETLRDPVMSRETSKDTARPHQTLRGSERSHETSSDETDAQQKLREENMQLKIDVEVRKQLLNQAAGEITRQRDHIEVLLRENGALQSQVLQLSAGKHDRLDLPPSPPVAPPDDPTQAYPRETVDNSTAANDAAL